MDALTAKVGALSVKEAPDGPMMTAKHLKLLPKDTLMQLCKDAGMSRTGNKAELAERLVARGQPYDDLTVPQLKELLKDQGLPLSGIKSDLILRLAAADRAPGPEPRAARGGDSSAGKSVKASKAAGESAVSGGAGSGSAPAVGPSSPAARKAAGGGSGSAGASGAGGHVVSSVPTPTVHEAHLRLLARPDLIDVCAVKSVELPRGYVSKDALVSLLVGSSVRYSDLVVEDLREMLSSLGLRSTGKRLELIARLVEAGAPAPELEPAPEPEAEPEASPKRHGHGAAPASKIPGEMSTAQYRKNLAAAGTPMYAPALGAPFPVAAGAAVCPRMPFAACLACCRTCLPPQVRGPRRLPHHRQGQQGRKPREELHGGVRQTEPLCRQEPRLHFRVPRRAGANHGRSEGQQGAVRV
jgi:hypothetical protein